MVLLVRRKYDPRKAGLNPLHGHEAEDPRQWFYHTKAYAIFRILKTLGCQALDTVLEDLQEELNHAEDPEIFEFLTDLKQLALKLKDGICEA